MKKGFSLIELLVSLVIISVVMVFLTSFVLNLRDEKGNVDIDIPMHINQAAISRTLNYDAVEYGGICNVTTNGTNAEIIYANTETRQIKLNNRTLTYKDGTKVELAKTLEGNKSFTSVEVASGYPKYYGNKILYKYVVSTGSANKDVEVVSYTDADICLPYLKYTITWKNADGTVLETDTNVAYGTTPSYNGSTPTKASTSNQSFAFNGWTPAVTTVTSDAIYTATYTTTTYTCSTGVSPSISGTTCTCSDTHEVEKTEYYAATPGNYGGHCYCSSTSTGNGDSWSGGCGHDTCSQECASIGLPYVMAGSNTTCPRSYSCDKPNSWGPDSSHYCGRYYYVNEAYTYDCTATTN